MRVICDFCEGAAAVVFCPDYKIALCGSCDLAVIFLLFLSFFFSFSFSYILRYASSSCF